MGRRKIILVIASLAIVVSLWIVWLNLRSPKPQFDPTPLIKRQIGVGQALAGETVKAVQDQGRIVIVTPYDQKNPHWRNDCWKAFQAELAKHPGIHIEPPEIVSLNLNGNCKKDKFKELLQRHASANAIVFFCGLPDWTDAQSSLSAPGSTKILVVDDASDGLGQWQYSGYLSSGFVKALIYASGIASSNVVVQPQTPREWFETYYRVYTPENYQTLPVTSTSP